MSDPLLPHERKSSITDWEKIGYGVVFCYGLFLQFLDWALSSDDCRGAGAAYPGGCPDFEQAITIVMLLVLAFDVSFLLVVLYGKIRLGRMARIFMFVLSSFFILYGHFWLTSLFDPLKR